MAKQTGIEKKSIIKCGDIDAISYFKSVSEQALSLGVLTQEDAEAIQLECISQLAEQTERYNGGASSSVRTEVAQELAASFMYTIGVYLKSLPSPDDAAAALRDETVATMLLKGRKLLRKKLNVAKLFYLRIKNTLFNTPNDFYSATAVDGIAGFFKLYKPEFFAQETHITADYPLCVPVTGLSGIEFIEKYIENLYYENDFLCHFQPDDVHKLMCGASKEYQTLVINIFEPVMSAAIGCVLSGADPLKLRITKNHVKELESALSKHSDSELAKLLFYAEYRLSGLLSLSTKTDGYLRQALRHIGVNIRNAVREGRLETVIPTQAVRKAPPIVCAFEHSMEDELFRNVLSEIECCPTAHAKSEVIKKFTHSLGDLYDILCEPILIESELPSVFREMSLRELSAFSKKFEIFSDFTPDNLLEGEEKLYRALKSYLNSMSAEKKKEVKKTAGLIEIKY